MAYTFNPFTGAFDNAPSTLKGDSAYTNLVENSAAYLSAVDLSFLSVSANWDSTYNTVQSNSAVNWNYQGTDIKSLTGNWESTYTTFRDASSTFLTSEIDSQTLSFDEGTKDLTISNGNTVSLSSFNVALGSYLPLSGGTMTGKLIASADDSFSKLNIGGSLSVGAPATTVNGDIWITNQNRLAYKSNNVVVNLAGLSQQNTFSQPQSIGSTSNASPVFTANNTGSREAAVFTAQGTSPAVRITQIGTGNALTIEDSTNPDATPFVIDALGSVGIGLSSLSGVDAKLTVVGNVSATEVIYASGGNSNIWNSSYNIATAYSAASSTFLTSETDSQTLSFDEGTKDLSISNGNTVSLSALVDTTTIDTEVRALTSNWESTYETVSALSASWAATEGAYLPLSGGTITGNLQVSGTTTLSGSVEIGTGAGDAKFFVGGGKVGVGTETPNEELTVVGNISASNVVYASGGNSILWNEVFTSYSSNSSTFITSETDSQTLSFDEVTKDLSISNGNSVSLSALVDTTAIDTGVRALTSNWESTYNTVSALSASWSAADEVLLAQVTNADSVTLNRGDVVYSFGATGSVMSVKLASNSGDSTSATTLGVVNETIIPNGIGYVTVAGRMEQMSFPHPFVDGDILYLGNTPGTFTRVKPVAPEHGVYLGVVERANNGNGIVYVKVQNGYELNEIHDVLITSVSAGQVIRRNSTNNLWINTNDGANWDSVYTTVTAASANWQGTYTNFSANSAVYVKTVATTTPGTSAITTIVAVSALPPTQVPGTLYILI